MEPRASQCSLIARNSGALDRNKEFYILLPTTGQSLKIWPQNALLSLSSYLKSKEKVVPGSYLSSVLNARGKIK